MNDKDNNTRLSVIRDFTDAARAAGCCDMLNDVATLRRLSALYFSPQGREFCRAHRLPTAAMWQRFAEAWPEAEMQQRGFYIGHPCTGLDAVNPGNIAIIGEGVEATVIVRGSEAVQRIEALCGARVSVIASDYAVVEIYADDDSAITITKDVTVIQL